MACGACLHTRPRLINHLKHGTTDCLSRYIVNHPVLTGDEVAKLDDLDRTARKKLHGRGLRETHARIPALHTMSPAIFHLEPTLEHIALSQPVAGPTCILPDSEEGTQQIAGYRLDNSQTALVILCAQGPGRCIDLQFKVKILAAIPGLPILFLHVDVTSYWTSNVTSALQRYSARKHVLLDETQFNKARLGYCVLCPAEHLEYDTRSSSDAY